MLRHSATIKDVARKAQVSTETKDAVDNGVRELKYSRNEVTRSLKTRLTWMIGVISPELTNDFFMGSRTASKTN
jgi:DNA-binding LacI/PurR family transcriptional regulator